MEKKVKEVLEKQLQLLSERSQEHPVHCDLSELAEVSVAMIEIAKALD